MRFIDTIEETYIALSANKARSGLTILGIVIGISSVIAMVSIGAGASASISSSVESLGSNLILITPGTQRTQGYGVRSSGSAQSLTREDLEAIRDNVSGIAAITGEVSGRYQITAPGTNTNTTVNGVGPDYANIRNVEVAEGSFISDQHESAASKVAVLGPTVRDDLFGENADGVVGQKIRINGMQFTVVGITASKGTSGMSNQDDTVYIPSTTAGRFLAGNSYYTNIDVQAQSSEAMTTVQEDITTLLLKRHRIADAADADFRILNQNDLLSTASSITSTLTYLLAAIGSISLLVGGIGIMNMMLTTVTERTREIGLRKAIGARRRDITQQFLTEAVTLTVVGGAIGIVFGWLIALAVNMTGLLTTDVTFSSVAIAFGVSAMVGVLFGYYPARRAANFNPIEALRYE